MLCMRVTVIYVNILILRNIFIVTNLEAQTLRCLIIMLVLSFHEFLKLSVLIVRKNKDSGSLTESSSHRMRSSLSARCDRGIGQKTSSSRVRSWARETPLPMGRSRGYHFTKGNIHRLAQNISCLNMSVTFAYIVLQ